MRFLPLVFGALLPALCTSAQDEPAARTPVQAHVLSSDSLVRLASKDGAWIHLAAFRQWKQTRHLLCRKTAKQKTPTCVVASNKGRVLRKTVAFGHYRNSNHVAFRVSSKKKDRWLPMRLQIPSSATPSASHTAWSDFAGAFGHEPSNVHFHDDPVSTDDMGARAFTNGTHVVVMGGTKSDGDPGLVAHELNQAVVESSGGNNPTNTGDGDTGGETSGEEASGGETTGGENGSGNTGSENTGSENTGSN